MNEKRYIAKRPYAPISDALSEAAANLLGFICSCGIGTIIAVSDMFRWSDNLDEINFYLKELIEEGEIEEYKGE